MSQKHSCLQEQVSRRKPDEIQALSLSGGALGRSALTHALFCHRGTLYVEPSLADKLGRFPDSYLSVANGWNKGLIFINGYNIVRAGCLECMCLRAS